MSERAEYIPTQHEARVRRTNTDWAIGQVGGVIGARLLGASPRVSAGVLGATEAGWIGHRIWQETGDRGLAAEVAAVRAVFAIGAIGALIATFPATVLAIGATILGIDNLIHHQSATPLPWVTVLVCLVVAVLCWVAFVRVVRENNRLKATGRPRDKYLRHAGYHPVGDYWIKPGPGQTVPDALREQGMLL